MTQAVRPMPEEMPVELWRGVKPSSAAWQGRVISIFVAPKSADEMVPLSSVRALADRGLEGDRFFRDSWNAIARSDKAVSFIEDEVLELAAEELGLESIAQKTRRNIVTRGVPLIDLLHREFVVGDVRMRGIRLFEPCGHLVQVSKLPGIFKALNHRSGLKAAILTDGVIGVGDRIMLHSTAATAAL
ncbi:MAG TPA: MOSC domain-containing protein [Candidatus Eisenbacteria bacterium]|jgi:MOSC domain-containing protein YiiM|nr:MOSC domain-containing protein [Candidatus Eisenbacteria bacterium]